MSRSARDALILDHRYLVPPIVREVKAGLPAHVRWDDLESAGYLGLVLAARDFDPSRGVPFKRWAALKIHGAIGDELRAGDQRLGPRLAKHQTALSLDVPLPTMPVGETWWDQVTFELPAPGADLEDLAIARLEAFHLQRAVAALPAHLRTVVHAAFQADRTHRESAAAAGIPPGDFYLLRSEAIRALRTALGVPAPAGERRVPLPRRLAHLAA